MICKTKRCCRAASCSSSGWRAVWAIMSLLDLKLKSFLFLSIEQSRDRRAQNGYNTQDNEHDRWAATNKASPAGGIGYDPRPTRPPNRRRGVRRRAWAAAAHGLRHGLQCPALPGGPSAGGGGAPAGWG